MMVKLLDVFLRWYNEVTSCFYQESSRCLSVTVGFSSVLCFVLSYLVLLGGRCKLRGALTAAMCALYSLIGNLCNVTGAFLSNQSLLQLTVALLLVMLDFVHFISVTLMVCWWRHSKTGRKARMLNRRRRQNSLAVCLLLGMGGCVYFEELIQYTPRYSPPTSRKLLNVTVHLALVTWACSGLRGTAKPRFFLSGSQVVKQTHGIAILLFYASDHIGLLGYVLGLLSFVISSTSRFPFLLKSDRAKMSNPANVSSRVFNVLAGALYTSAIVLYDPQMQSVVKALPWILSGTCCALLDTAILLLSCYNICYKQWSVRLLRLDNESLLGRFSSANTDQHPSSKGKEIKKHRLPPRVSSSPNLPQMGHYLDVSVQPVRKVCLKEVTMTREGSAECQSQKRCVKVVRVDECYSSDSTTDSLCVSSELEWDFEEAAPQWSSQNGKHGNAEDFALRDWMVDQRSKSNTRSSLRACFCNNAALVETASGTGETNLSLSDSIK